MHLLAFSACRSSLDNRIQGGSERFFGMVLGMDMLLRIDSHMLVACSAIHLSRVMVQNRKLHHHVRNAKNASPCTMRQWQMGGGSNEAHEQRLPRESNAALNLVAQVVGL